MTQDHPATLEQAPPAESLPAVPPLLPTPNWARPDDAERRDRLNAMKRRATSLLGLAGGAVPAPPRHQDPAHRHRGHPQRPDWPGARQFRPEPLPLPRRDRGQPHGRETRPTGRAPAWVPGD